MIGHAVPGLPVHLGVVRNHIENVENSELSFCRLTAAAAALQAGLVLHDSREKTHLAHDGSVKKKTNQRFALGCLSGPLILFYFFVENFLTRKCTDL